MLINFTYIFSNFVYYVELADVMLEFIQKYI